MATTGNSNAVRSGIVAAVIAVVIWLAISIATGGTVRSDIVGAVVVGLIAAAIGVGFSIYFGGRRGPPG